MRIVLDANVIVSAMISAGGAPDSVFRAWKQEAYSLVTSLPLLEELETVLSYPRIRRRLPFDDAGVRQLVMEIALGSEVVQPMFSIEAVDRDPDDNRVLEAAVAGRADYIVTGDRDLLALRSYNRIQIISPARFLAILATGSRSDT